VRSYLPLPFSSWLWLLFAPAPARSLAWRAVKASWASRSRRRTDSSRGRIVAMPLAFSKSSCASRSGVCLGHVQCAPTSARPRRLRAAQGPGAEECSPRILAAMRLTAPTRRQYRFRHHRHGLLYRLIVADSSSSRTHLTGLAGTVMTNYDEAGASQRRAVPRRRMICQPYRHDAHRRARFPSRRGWRHRTAGPQHRHAQP